MIFQEENMKKMIGLLVCLFALSGLSACNTVQGFGKDVKTVGEKMENAAAKKQQ